jgi:hypothetical protein
VASRLLVKILVKHLFVLTTYITALIKLARLLAPQKVIRVVAANVYVLRSLHVVVVLALSTALLLHKNAHLVTKAGKVHNLRIVVTRYGKEKAVKVKTKCAVMMVGAMIQTYFVILILLVPFNKTV